MLSRIAVFTKNRTNPAYEAARLGADRVAARLGATTIHYVPHQPDSVPEQIALIKLAVAEQPDAVLFTPVHETAVNDAILLFEAASIPLFGFVTRTTAGRSLCFVGSDDHALAADIARYLCSKINGRGEIAILEGTPASATSHERLRGFHDALAAYPSVTLRSSLCGEYQRDVARKAYLDAAHKLQSIDAVLCANDAMALGVLDAFQTTLSNHKRPLVVGVNAVPEAIAAIASGHMLATANFDAMTMSAIATEAAVRYLRGETVPGEIILPVKIVDATNCARWNLPFQARSCATWEEVTGSPTTLNEVGPST